MTKPALLLLAVATLLADALFFFWSRMEERERRVAMPAMTTPTMTPVAAQAVLAAPAAQTAASLSAVAALRERMASLEISLITEVGEPPEDYALHQAAPVELEVYASLLGHELDLYPEALLRRLRLRRIVLCARLTENATGEVMSGLADHTTATIYLDVSDSARVGPSHQRKVVHHELFHQLDAVNRRRGEYDPLVGWKWEALNRGAFEYAGETEEISEDQQSGHLTCLWPGFVTHYAMCSVAEDKAEVFACMMTLPNWVAYLGAADEIVGSKVDEVRRILAEFCADADANFWEAVAREHQMDTVSIRGGDPMEILRTREVE